MKTILKSVLLVNCMLLLSCSNEESMNTAGSETNTTEKVNSQISQEVLDDMIQSLPQSIEIAQIISNSKVELDKDVMIPSHLADRLESRESVALLLGGYGVDLGYINLNNKHIYMIEYLEAVKKLSVKLKVEQFFDFETLSKLVKNKNNSDSLIQLSTSNFNKISNYLREQNRGEQSVLILIGAWMEGMNMFGDIYTKTHSEDISRRIAEQKIVFDNIHSIIEKLNSIPFYKKLEISFSPLKAAFDKVKINYVYKEPKMEEVNGTLVLKDQTEMNVDFSAEDLNQIVAELQKLRNEYFIIK